MDATFRRRKRLMSEINVVPYIDVMLVLLVIFMITAPLLTQGVKIDLPQAPSEPLDTQDQETLVVGIDRDGRYYLDDRRVSPAELRKRVQGILRARPQTPVMLRGDKAVPYGRVIEAMTLLQQAGAPSVGLITVPPAPTERGA
ncbi:MAG TPA: protein TolR [Burkholderiales bacterium]